MRVEVPTISEKTGPDPLAGVPSPEVIRALISEQVRRTELLRHLLRVALRRERQLSAGKGAANG
jgi:hypothetical protein